jgi:hypothetical protein
MKIEYIDTLPIKDEINGYRNTKYIYLDNNNNNNENNGENKRQIWIHNIKYCLLTGKNLYYPNALIYSINDFKLYLPYREKTMSLNMGSIYESTGMEFNLNGDCGDGVVDNDIKICNTENMFFFIYNTDNYYHFIYDTVPILISFFHLKKKYTDMKLLMNYPNSNMQHFYKFIIETLEILGLENSIEIVSPDTIYKNLFVSTSYTHDLDSNAPPHSKIFDIYKYMINNIFSKIPQNEIEYFKKSLPKKIYISRRTWLHNDTSNIGTNYTTRRKMTNEDILVNLLKSKGYTEIFTENMSMKDKILMFNNAESVIGAIGGGISNVVFSKKECKLIALVSPYFLDINNRFKYSLDCVNTNYFMNCYNTEKGEFKKYMRVKYKELPIIGEIEEINGDLLSIKCTDGSNTGWNSESKYELLHILKNDVEPLDNGLNSPWYVDLDNLDNLL